jgi:serine/threonine protein kinase
MASSVPASVRVVGRYALHGEIAAGGMATVHYGRLLGQAGFSRTVAIKRLHAQYAKDPDFVAMFLDEARLAARIHHPNVVSTLDVVAREGELFLVMEYVHGEALSKLVKRAAARGQPIAPRIAGAIVSGFLHGLHAAHEARNERGEPLEIVHRDISPQNVLVGGDGVPRVVDFGVAKAIGQVHTTREGQLKGKLAYMAPEQIHGFAVTRRTDVYAASIVFWEMLTGQRLFARDTEAAVMLAALTSTPPAPSSVLPSLPTALDRVVLRGLARKPEARFQTARDMALAIEQAIDVALPSEVGAWLQSIAPETLAERAACVAEIESQAGVERHVASERPSGADPATDAAAAAPTSSDGRTQYTSVSPSPPSMSPGAGSRWQIAVAVAIGLLVAALFTLPRFGGSPAPPRTSSSAPTDSSAPVAPPPSTSASVAQTPEPRAPSTATPREVPPAPPPPSRPQPMSRPSSTTPRRAPATANCDPPYRVDASGRKIFKLECL